jgi:hypothetical protein
MSGPVSLFPLTYWLIKAATLLCGLAVVALSLALCVIPLIASGLDGGYFALPAIIEGIPRANVLAFAAFALASWLICVLLIFAALRAAIGIMATAMTGDPFVTENAHRLTRIGWLLLIVQAVSLVTSLVYAAMPETLKHVWLFLGPSPVGLLGILLVFVLARIFRSGSEMRADLEGTV